MTDHAPAGRHTLHNPKQFHACFFKKATGCIFTVLFIVLRSLLIYYN
jgi:hypothetical protein